MEGAWHCGSFETAGVKSQIPVPAVVKMQHGAFSGNTENNH